MTSQSLAQGQRDSRQLCLVSSPAIGADGTVYIGSADGNVYAFK